MRKFTSIIQRYVRTVIILNHIDLTSIFPMNTTNFSTGFEGMDCYWAFTVIQSVTIDRFHLLANH